MTRLHLFLKSRQQEYTPNKTQITAQPETNKCPRTDTDICILTPGAQDPSRHKYHKQTRKSDLVKTEKYAKGNLPFKTYATVTLYL